MRTTGKVERLKWDYFEKVDIPEKLRIYMWDCGNDAYLEMLLLKTLTYGSFEDIKLIFELYPEQTYKIAFKYPEIPRGARYWVKLWKEQMNM